MIGKLAVLAACLAEAAAFAETEKARRASLRDELGDEPEAGAGAIVSVALRIPKSKGPRLQRRFLESDPLARVFEWADADAELDPATLTLTPAGGGADLSLEKDGARKLAELDLGKMALLQVGVRA